MLLLVTLFGAAVFSGGAMLVTVAEQPARLALDDLPMLTEWRRSYDRAAPLQAGLALFTGVAGLIAWWSASSSWSLVGALLILACWPFVLLVVMPVNRRLQALAPAQLSEARSLVIQWGRLHTVRTILGLAATGAFAVAAHSAIQ